MKDYVSQNSYEMGDELLDVVDFGEKMGWALTPGETFLIPEMNNHSCAAKFFNFGGMAFIFMSFQFLVYCKQIYTTAKAAYYSESKADQMEWLLHFVENIFLAVLTVLAIITSFFVLSFLMIPVIAILSSYDVIIDIIELFEINEKYKHAKSNVEHNKLYKLKKELRIQLFADIGILIFSIMSCFNAPIISTIGTIGCVLAGLIPVCSYLWSSCHTPIISQPEIEMSPIHQVGMFAKKQALTTQNHETCHINKTWAMGAAV